MSEIFNICIVRHGDNRLNGTWLNLPATDEHLKMALNEIGLKEAIQENIFISDFKTSLSVLDNAPPCDKRGPKRA